MEVIDKKINNCILNESSIEDYYKVVKKIDRYYRAEKKKLYEYFPNKKAKLEFDKRMLKENLTDIINFISVKIDNEPNIVIIGTREGHFAKGFIELFNEYLTSKNPMYFITKDEYILDDYIPMASRNLKPIDCNEITEHIKPMSENAIIERINHEKPNDNGIDLLICFDFLHIFRTEDIIKIIHNYYSALGKGAFLMLGWKSFRHKWKGKGAKISTDYNGDNNITAETWDSRSFRPVKYVKDHKSLLHLIEGDDIFDLLEDKSKEFNLTKKEFDYASEKQSYIPAYNMSLFKKKN